MKNRQVQNCKLRLRWNAAFTRRKGREINEPRFEHFGLKCEAYEKL